MNLSLSTNRTVEQQFDQFLIRTYHQFPVAVARGEGSRVWDVEGREYLDFFPGGGCNLLGHCPEKVVSAVRSQAGELILASHGWLQPLQAMWAERLVETVEFGAKVFFCNSGSEANEAAIKLARLHTPGERYKIISFHGGSHGFTLGSLTASAQTRYHEDLGPLAAGFVYCPWGDAAAVESLIDSSTAAILVEPIQCQAGVRMPPDGFLATLRELADRHEVVLIFDESYTAMGRTGDWYAHQHFGVAPDIVTVSKALCGGLAGAAIIARNEIAESFRPGLHGSTFGGNPIAAAAGLATIETIRGAGLLARADEIGRLLIDKLNVMAADLELVRAVHGVGMMIGIELDIEGQPIVAECLAGGLLIDCVQKTHLRLLPALNIDEESLQQGFEILRRAIESAQRNPVEV